MANKIYTSYWTDTVNPGMNISYTFDIFSQGRTMKIKSILLDLKLLCIGGAPGLLPHELNRTQVFSLKVGNPKIGSTFENIGALTPLSNGDYFYITLPKQVHFNSFFVSERLSFVWKYSNTEAVNIHRPELSILVETEEKINYT